ncbi:short-chain dehydrogenase/reductase family 16C member 6-like [Anthonomus grandis grandis]|uniref:short-chain dehydrogenase/reductase family 16C member 6-like n=1 Tax=Anthonomus grandis grandis TaxID=2921223 RepID=UPI0021653C3C|nr:short-chain dehydrogenase/reductase family 16C member 6-like [Anthonomus grandis grandis]
MAYIQIDKENKKSSRINSMLSSIGLILKSIPSISATLLLAIYYIVEAFILRLTPNFLRSLKSLKGSTVLVTGGASGLGRELVLLLVNHEANVVVWDINETAMFKLKDELNKKGFNIFVYTVDVADLTAIYKAVELVKNDLGPIDILINNAGFVYGDTFLNIPDKFIEKTYKINTLACYWTTKAILPDMIKRKSGHIATIGSLSGLLGTYNCTDYSGSKYALIGFHESLLVELQSKGYDKIGLTMICPYFINTRMFDGCNPKLRSMLDPTEVASRVILAIRRKEIFCAIPGYSCYVLAIKNCLPSKLLLLIQSKVLRLSEEMKNMRKFKDDSEF